MVLIFLATSVSLVAGYILCKKVYAGKQKKNGDSSSVVNAFQIGDDNKILVTIDTGSGKKAQVCVPVFRVSKSVVQEKKLGFYPDSQDPNAESYAYSHSYVGVRDNDAEVLLLPPLNYTGKLHSPHFRYESKTGEKIFLSGDTSSSTTTEGGFFGLWSEALRKIFDSPKQATVVSRRRNIYDD